MAENKIVKYSTRVQLKYDTWSNWNSTAGKAFIPLKGEVCCCEVPASTNAGEQIAEKAFLIKIGDGSTTFGALPWLSANAADVYTWAKKSETEFLTWLEANTSYASESVVEGLSSSVSGHIANKSNPHEVTKTQVGLGNVTNNKQIPAIASSTANSIVAFSGTDGTTVKSTGVTVSSLQTATQTAQSKADDAYSKAETNASNIATNTTNITNIVNGTTKVGKAGAADSATTATTASKLGSSTVGATGKPIYLNAGVPTEITTLSIGTTGNAATATKATQDASGNVITSTYATKSELTALSNKVTNAMHFIGTTTTAISDGSTTSSIVVDRSTVAAAKGDVVLYNGYEYVWTGSAWEQLGQEGSFAIKGSIVNADIADNAAIAQSKISGLSTKLGEIDDSISNHGGRLTSVESTASTASTNASSALAKIEALDVSAPTASGTGTAFITSVSQTNGKISASKASLPTATAAASGAASGGTAGIVSLSSSVASSSESVAATSKAVKTAYDLANTANTTANSAASTASTASTNATSALNQIGAMDLTDPTASGTATSFIATVSQTDGKVTATKANLPTASTSVVGIVKLSTSTNSTSKSLAATPSAVKSAYDLADSAKTQANTNASNISTLNGTAWKTSAASSVTQATSGATTTSNLTSLAASNLTIGDDSIGYIIFDCGSSTVNI